MAHIPVDGTYFPWYTRWAKKEQWELVQQKEISEQEIAGLIDD